MRAETRSDWSDSDRDGRIEEEWDEGAREGESFVRINGPGMVRDGNGRQSGIEGGPEIGVDPDAASGKEAGVGASTGLPSFISAATSEAGWRVSDHKGTFEVLLKIDEYKLMYILRPLYSPVND